MQKSVKRLKIILFAMFIVFSLSSCSVFKRECDCPKVYYEREEVEEDIVKNLNYINYEEQKIGI